MITKNQLRYYVQRRLLKTPMRECIAWFLTLWNGRGGTKDIIKSDLMVNNIHDNLVLEEPNGVI